jgi:hypothetical protein
LHFSVLPNSGYAATIFARSESDYTAILARHHVAQIQNSLPYDVLKEWTAHEQTFKPTSAPREAGALSKEARIANNIPCNRPGSDQPLRDAGNSVHALQKRRPESRLNLCGVCSRVVAG